MAEDDSKFEQVDRRNEQSKMAIDHAVDEIMVKFTDVGMPGANSSEPGELLELVKLVKAAKIDPKAAIERANEIYESKNMYH